MKLCLIADLHLPYHPDAVHYDVFDWALKDLQKKQADAVVFAGDFTADGHPDALRRFREKLAGFPVPAVVIPGNSDFRTPDTAAEVRTMASPAVTETGGIRILSLADGERSISGDVYALLETADDRTVVCAHHPFGCMPEPHRSRLTAWRESHPDVPLFFAHLHLAERQTDGSYILPAADPDKNIGAPPAISYYDTGTRELRQAHYHCPVPYDFAQYLALSCHCPADIEYAVTRRPGCIELRGGLLTEESLPLIERWREAGGHTLSLHAPELIVNGSYNADVWKSFAEFAEAVSADRITLHVPDITSHTATDERLGEIAEFAARNLDNLPDTFVIGIENMHMTAKDTVENRRFGYVPEECLRFVRILREHTSKKVGIHLDTGHARNNHPFNWKYTTGAWYAETGAEIVGYHIHQYARNAAGQLENHQPIGDWYGKYISYASFFRAWEKGQLAKAPVILEIRPDGGYKETFDLLDREIPVFDLHSHTHYSFCGRDLPQDLVDTMVQNGVRLLGITDHNYGIGKRKAEYERVIRQLAADNAEKIRILCGIEIATIPGNFDISDPAEIAGYDYCLLEHIDHPDSLARDDLFGFAEKLGIRCGIAHTDMFAYCDNRGYDRREFFGKLAEHGIFWEMNVSYDSIHRYREHPYVADFMNDPEKQAIVRDAGMYISVGFDGHRREDYDGYKVAETIRFLKKAGIRTADQLFADK